MKRDAEAHADEDRKKRELVEAKNRADSLVYTAEKSLRDAGDLPDGKAGKIEQSIKDEIQQKIDALKKVKEGNDVTLISYGATMVPAKEATRLAAEENIDVELIDLRTLAPLDSEAILDSAKKTGRVVITHEAPKTLGMGAEISALISEKAVEYLQAPILRVAGLDAPVPYSLESTYLLNAKRILTSVNKVASYK